MELTRWGIIGPGNIAPFFVKDLSFAASRHQVTAILGHDEENTRAFAEEYGIADHFIELDDFLQKRNFNVVYIATPHAQHFEQTLACLEHRIPVLCEKPITLNADQCRQLVATARENDTFLMEGMWLRFLPSIRHVLSMVRQGVIGRVTSIHASISYKAPHDPDSRYFDPEQGGGSLLDLGIYPVFLALMLMGKPHSIQAIGKLSEEGVDEACSMLLHYKDGSHATLESSLVSTLDIPAEIVGEKGVIKILQPWFEKATGIELEREGEGKIIYPCHWQGHGLYFEAEEVSQCLRQNKIDSELLSHEFSLDMIGVLDEIRNQIHVTYDMYE